MVTTKIENKKIVGHRPGWLFTGVKTDKILWVNHFHGDGKEKHDMNKFKTDIYVANKPVLKQEIEFTLFEKFDITCEREMLDFYYNNRYKNYIKINDTEGLCFSNEGLLYFYDISKCKKIEVPPLETIT